MRMSRLAALKTDGLIWDKYKYSYKSQRSAKSYTFTDWKLESSGDSGGWANGYDGYVVEVDDDYGWETYRIGYSGYSEYINSTNPGTVYWTNGNELRKTTVNSDGSWTKYYCHLDPTYTYHDSVWMVQDYIGKVRAKKGTLPDAGRGYIYEKIDGEYTIMRKPGEGSMGATYDYCAYKLRG